MQEKKSDKEQVIKDAEVQSENTQECGKFDIKKMNKEELRAIAEALINENTELEKQTKLLITEKEKLTKIAEKASDLSTMYSAISKDFEQYRKRNAEIEATSKDNAMVDIGLKILPVFDNLKLAIESVKEEKSKEGVTLIYRQFSDILTSIGITQFKSEGEEFDPVKHNALMAEDTDNDALKGKIKLAFSDGYSFKDKIIKQSQVIVYK